MAEQVDVIIHESNSDRAAVEGAFEPDDLVVTGSSRIVSSGDRVRLADA